jgi:hypothetical protein
MHGWSDACIQEAAKTLGYPSVAAGLIPGGTCGLVRELVAQLNKDATDELLAAQSLRYGHCENPVDFVTSLSARITRESDLIQEGLELRLKLMTPWIKSWPQVVKFVNQLLRGRV